MDSIATSAILLFFLSSVCAICPDAWTKYENYCFALFEGTTTWTDAGALCHEFGGHLATLNTTKKIQNAKSFVTYVNHKGNVWIGGSDMALLGMWTWDVDLKTITTTDWGRNHPVSDTKRQCIIMSVSDSFKWHSAWCGSKFDYLCERRSIPT